LEFEKILQELTSNVLKHSDAKNVRVFLSLDEDKLRLEYSDDGVGGAVVDPERKGYGLAGIAERVKMLGGDFKLDSPQGEGTKVVILLPNRGRKEEL
jgi:signal transduction histidine kinase